MGFNRRREQHDFAAAIDCGHATLESIQAAGITHLNVACCYHECRKRVGRYQVARLIKAHGNKSLEDLKHIINPDCPRWKALSRFDRCGIHFPGLPADLRR